MATQQVLKMAEAYARARRFPPAARPVAPAHMNGGDAGAVRRHQTTGDLRFHPDPNRKAYNQAGDIPALPERFDAFEWQLAGWPVRNEGVNENCVSFAAIACLEYLLATDHMAGPALSPQSLIHAIKCKDPRSGPRDPHPERGYTYLRWAYDALETAGVCTEDQYPYAGPITAPPPTTARPVAPKFTVVYRDHPFKTLKTNAAEDVYACLAGNKQPVAICLPIFFDPSSNGRLPTNWTTDDALHHGVVGDPREGLAAQGEDVAANHCVCVTGFIPCYKERNGGYFVFRNCAGTQLWGHFAPSTLLGPTAPRPGYGIVSATYVRHYCLEMLQLNHPKR